MCIPTGCLPVGSGGALLTAMLQSAAVLTCWRGDCKVEIEEQRVRKLVMIAIGLALLVGCQAAVPIPRAGQLLYVTTFDAFNEDWQLFQGELAAEIVGTDAGPALQISVDALQSGAFTVLEQEFGDFDVKVDVLQVAGPLDLDAPGFGILFRHRDNNNFYAFMISGDGYYQVVRRLNGVDEELSDWAPTPAIVQGLVVNQVRVVGQGNAFKFFVNDVQLPICTTIWNPLVAGECQVPAAVPGGEPTWSPEGASMVLVDDALARGKIGLGARSFAQAGVRIYFDNLLVCGPAAEPPIPFRCEESGLGGS